MSHFTRADGRPADAPPPMHAPLTVAPPILQAPPPPPAVGSQLERAANDVAQDLRAAAQGANAATQGRVAAAQGVVDALRGQIAAETGTISRLTSQLVPGMSDASVGAITTQLEQSQERLTSLQGQLDRALGTSESNAVVAPAFPPFPTDIPPGIQDITTGLFVMIAVIAIGVPLVRAFARRMDRRSVGADTAALSATLDPRLDRIEQAIEAVAIEVERISEGQRYTNKIMSEVRALPSPNPLNQWPPSGGKDPVPLKRQEER